MSKRKIIGLNTYWGATKNMKKLHDDNCIEKARTYIDDELKCSIEQNKYNFSRKL